jgi:hypothetical protein
MTLPPKPRSLFLFLLPAVLAGACETKTNSRTSSGPWQPPANATRVVVDSAKTQRLRDSLAILAAAPDTFRANNGRVFHLEVITEAQYKQVPAPYQERDFPPDSALAVATEARYLQSAAGHVWRVADTLFFKTEPGAVVRLQNGPTYQDAEDSYEGYRFLDNLSSIGQWLVEVGQWEGMYYLLIDQRTGKRTDLIGYPFVSPDQAHFACASSSPTGYNLNGLQLWLRPQGLPPQLRWQRVSNAEQPGIAALSPRWENSRTLVFYEDFIAAGRHVRIRL